MKEKSRILLLLVLLVFTWLFWSGLYKPVLLVLGALSCILTCYLAYRMRYFDDDTYPLRLSAGLLPYIVWIMKEVLHSSLEVSRLVLDPRLPVSSRVVEIDATALQPVDQVILGNSITLTPGTLTLDVHRGIIKVHCLTEDAAEALLSGDMLSRVVALRTG